MNIGGIVVNSSKDTMFYIIQITSGKGIEFQRSNNLKNEIELRLNFLSTKYDKEMFYEGIRNILHVWNAKSFDHDGSECAEEGCDVTN